MFNLARKLATKITRPYRIVCRCGQEDTLIANASTGNIEAAKVFVEGGWRWIEAEGGAVCRTCAAKLNLDEHSS